MGWAKAQSQVMSKIGRRPYRIPDLSASRPRGLHSYLFATFAKASRARGGVGKFSGAPCDHYFFTILVERTSDRIRRLCRRLDKQTLPPHMADLFQRREKFTTLANDLDVVKKFVRSNVTG